MDRFDKVWWTVILAFFILIGFDRAFRIITALGFAMFIVLFIDWVIRKIKENIEK